MPELGPGAARNKLSCGGPLSVAHGRRKWRPAVDRRALMLDIRAGVEQGVGQRDIVIAGGPMQWCFPMPHGNRRSVEVAADRGEDRGGVRTMSRPIGEEMQRRASTALFIHDHTTSEAGFVVEQPLEPLGLALLERCRKFNGKRFVAAQFAMIHAGLLFASLWIPRNRTTVFAYFAAKNRVNRNWPRPGRCRIASCLFYRRGSLCRPDGVQESVDFISETDALARKRLSGRQDLRGGGAGFARPVLHGGHIG